MYKFITDVDPKPGNAYGLTKCQKENRLLRIIAPGCNTAVEKQMTSFFGCIV